MKYRVFGRPNPSDRSAPVKYYPFPQWDTELNLRQVSQRIASHCTLTPADITAVLEAFLNDLPDELMKGHSIRLADLGILKMSFRANGQSSPEKVSARDIHTLRVLFLPGKELKRRLAKTEFRRGK